MRSSYLVLTSLYIYEHKRHGSWDKKSRTYSTATTPIFNSKTLYSFDSVRHSLTFYLYAYLCLCSIICWFSQLGIFCYILNLIHLLVFLSECGNWKCMCLNLISIFCFIYLSVIVIEQWVLYSEETYIGHFDIALIWMFYALIHLLFVI